jgi:hypothetical protein
VEDKQQAFWLPKFRDILSPNRHEETPTERWWTFSRLNGAVSEATVIFTHDAERTGNLKKVTKQLIYGSQISDDKVDPQQMICTWAPFAADSYVAAHGLRNSDLLSRQWKTADYNCLVPPVAWLSIVHSGIAMSQQDDSERFNVPNLGQTH